MPSKITQSNLPPNSWQGLNSPYTLPKSIFSDNTAIMMDNHRLFLNFSILFQSNSPDLRILYLTPPSQANYISSTPMHISIIKKNIIKILQGQTMEENNHPTEHCMQHPLSAAVEQITRVIK
jgi:hypothetical protein